MQATCLGVGFDDDLHMTTDSAFASQPVDCTSTWELETETFASLTAGSEFFACIFTEGCASHLGSLARLPPFASPQWLHINDLAATRADADLAGGALAAPAALPVMPMVCPHKLQTDLEQSVVAAKTPPQALNPDTPPVLPTLGKGRKVGGKDSVPGRQPASRKHWTPKEEAQFLKALDRFPKEVGTDPATGRVSVRLGPGVAEMISIVMGTRSCAQVRSHVQKHYIRQQREASRRGYS
jgi:hypothetical protein